MSILNTIKNIKAEDFVNYKKPSLFIGMGGCDWKCCFEAEVNNSICQNSALGQAPPLEISSEYLYKMYESNDITQAIVFGGLEPLYNEQSRNELIELIKGFREFSDDDIVIYTGYYPYEVYDFIKSILSFKNITVKFGRYIPDSPPKYDDVLGVYLASDNQYAVKLKNRPDIIQGLKETKGYCPCMVKQNENTLCCCSVFKKQSKGVCHCGLWEK